MTAGQAADWWRGQAHRRADECDRLRAEVVRLKGLILGERAAQQAELVGRRAEKGE